MGRVKRACAAARRMVRSSGDPPKRRLPIMHNSFLKCSCASLLAAAVTIMVVAATAQQPGQQQKQQKQAKQPIGVPVPPLGDGPFSFDTAEQHKIRVAVVSKGLEHPWSLAFLPDGNMLVTERPGRLRMIRDGKLDPVPISGVPAVRTIGNSGLMDVALHPKFPDNKLVYLAYNKPGANKQIATALAPGRLEGGRAGAPLADVRDIFAPDWVPANAQAYDSAWV